MKNMIENLFASNVCTDKILKTLMPKKFYKKYLLLKLNGEPLDSSTAKHIANAIKTWALKLGATHYSHWFCPLTNKTAEKQVSFIEINSKGNLIEDFNEKSLIKGETDASSFPNGGSRMTFEARGYTIWDYTSPIFIKSDSFNNKVVYIPTVFLSYNGIALDEKTPLLRAQENLNIQALKVLKILGLNNVKKVYMSLGAEQEYFLIKKSAFDNRLDLKMTGNTLFGADSVKTQEMCSHYFGMIQDDISGIMNEVDKILWKTGITAKLQHNEVAPCQHEFVPIFSVANIACDQNQVIMETIKNVAQKFGYVALFNEKPFKNINGSGKHANWSLDTDIGLNLFNIKQNDKLTFCTFFVAMIEAIDRYYKLIRLSCAYRNNDLRLGGNEAPPTIVSVFASDYVLQLIDSLCNNKTIKLNKSVLETSVKCLPKTEKDFCDRNRTSPFAFTNNKFEFRMVGASQSINFPTTCICTMLSKVLAEYAEKLKESNSDDIAKFIKERYLLHSRIVFNGNGYDKEWHLLAKQRGLVEYNDSLSVYPTLLDKDIIELFKTTNVLNEQELALRQTTLYTNYFDNIVTEAKTMVELVNKYILPSLNDNISILHDKINSNKNIKLQLLTAYDKIYNISIKIKKEIDTFDDLNTIKNKISHIKNLIKDMQILRDLYDNIEPLISKQCMPFANYNEILF